MNYGGWIRYQIFDLQFSIIHWVLEFVSFPTPETTPRTKEKIMKRAHGFMMISLISIAILLSSCFIPDNYEAEVWLHKDGSYEFFYEGNLKYAPAIEKIMNGEFSDEDIEEMFELSDDLSNSEGFMEAEYDEDGIFTVDVIISRDPGETYDFISEDIKFFTFHYDDKGRLVISGPDLSDEDREGLVKLDIDMNGKLIVIADKGVKVKSDNANKKRKIEKKKVQYEWVLDLNSNKPKMLIK